MKEKLHIIYYKNNFLLWVATDEPVEDRDILQEKLDYYALPFKLSRSNRVQADLTLAYVEQDGQVLSFQESEELAKQNTDELNFVWQKKSTCLYLLTQENWDVLYLFYKENIARDIFGYDFAVFTKLYSVTLNLLKKGFFLPHLIQNPRTSAFDLQWQADLVPALVEWLYRIKIPPIFFAWQETDDFVLPCNPPSLPPLNYLIDTLARDYSVALPFQSDHHGIYDNFFSQLTRQKKAFTWKHEDSLPLLLKANTSFYGCSLQQKKLVVRIYAPSEKVGKEYIWVFKVFCLEGEELSPWSENPLGHKYLFKNFYILNEEIKKLSDHPLDYELGEFELNHQAFTIFLKENMHRLQKEGITLQFPHNFVKSQQKPKVKLRQKDRFFSQEKSMNWQEINTFDVEVFLHEHKLSAQEIADILADNSDFVLLEDEWIEIDKNALKKALKLLDEESLSLKVQEAFLLNVGLLMENVVSDKKYEGIWIDSVEMQQDFFSLKTTVLNTEVHDFEKEDICFNGTLREYQKVGVQWLKTMQTHQLGVCLADDMGLGKTIQTLYFLQLCKKKDNNHKTLLVAPTSVIDNWLHEAQFFTPDLNILVHRGKDRAQDDFDEKVIPFDVILTSYTVVIKDLIHLQSVNYDCIVVDEAQNIKTPFTKRAMSLKSFGCGFRVALTGTPVENHIGDLWALMDFLNPGLLGEQRRFYNYFQMTDNNVRLDQLKIMTDPLILRRNKNDPTIIDDLPSKVEKKEYCSLSLEQVKLYQQVIRQVEEETPQLQKGYLLNVIMKLKQICNHPALFLKEKVDFNADFAARSGKVLRLLELVNTALETKDSILVFTQFATMATMLHGYLKTQLKTPVDVIHGSTKQQDRVRITQEFQTLTDEPRVLILSLKVGGIGLNLTKANYVIHFDRWWNPAVENQATDRAFRIGQKKNVFVHKFISSQTLEEKIDKLIAGKQELASNVINDSGSWAKDLDVKGMKNLIQLSQELIGSLHE